MGLQSRVPRYAFGGDVNIDDYIASNEKLEGLLDQYDYVLAGHNDPWVESDVIRRVSEAFEAIADGTADYSEDDGLRRYFFQGFDVLTRTEMVEGMSS